MNKQLLAGLMLATAAALTGCGGGGGSSTTPPPDDGGTVTPPPPAPPSKVNGPLDAVQEPISSQVMSPLSGAFAGTPIAPVLTCVDQIVVNDAVDVLDAMAIAVQGATVTGDPAAAFQAMADEVQDQLQLVVADLQGLLSGLAGSATACLAAPSIGSNPLAGTPLAAVGEQLAPVLALVNQQVGGSQTPSLTALASTFAQLNAAVSTAFDSIPAEVSGAPVMGPALAAVEQALGNAYAALVAGMSQDVDATRLAIQTGVEQATYALVLQVVPIQAIEAGAGQPGVISGPLAGAIEQLGGVIASDLGPVQQIVFEQRLSTEMGAITDPLENGVLNMVLPAIDDILSGIPAGLPELVELTEVTEGLDTVLATGSLLDDILGAECPFAGTVLDALCGV